jgi:hypothetical protein
VTFQQAGRSWSIEDEFLGDAFNHEFEVWFHLAPDLLLRITDTGVEARDPTSNLTLEIHSLSLSVRCTGTTIHVPRLRGNERILFRVLRFSDRHRSLCGKSPQRRKGAKDLAVDYVFFASFPLAMFFFALCALRRT